MFSARMGFIKTSAVPPPVIPGFTLVANVARSGGGTREFEFRLTGAGANSSVDWGDGNVETITGGVNPIHRYANSTTLKTIKIVGSTTGIELITANRIVDVTEWGPYTFTSPTDMFIDGRGLTTFTANDAPILVGTLTSMFEGCANLNEPKMATWNVSNVTGMNDMFNGASKFNQPIGNWVVSNVSSMNRMFQDASSFNQNLSSWTTNVASQPASFSLGANTNFANNTNLKKPFLRGGTIRINT